MRGDSLRDLYAKVIAVVGLGVLAGAGALVDYWPSGGIVPRVVIEKRSPALAVALPVPAGATAELPRPSVVRTARLRSLGVETAKPSPAVTADLNTSASLPVSHRIDLTRSSAAVLAAPPAATQPSVATSAQEPHDVPVTDVTDNAFTNSPVRLSAVSVSEDDGEGFIVGAAKKTRDSIVRTSRKTGASIFDAFRFVGGAMKKALPGT